MTLAYPVIQTKKASFTTTATPAAMSFDDPLSSVNSSILVAFGTNQNRSISSISDDLGGSYFSIGAIGGTNASSGAWMSKKREGTNPSISIVLSSSCSGNWMILEVANLSRGTTSATTLEPPGVGTMGSTQTSQNTNQFQSGDFATLRTTGGVQFVVSGMRFSQVITPSSTWRGSDQSGACYVGWRPAGATGAIATFQSVGTHTSDTFANLTFICELMKPILPNKGIRPRPFAPGLAR